MRVEMLSLEQLHTDGVALGIQKYGLSGRVSVVDVKMDYEAALHSSRDEHAALDSVDEDALLDQAKR